MISLKGGLKRPTVSIPLLHSGPRTLTDTWFRCAGITPQPVMELCSVEAIKTLVGSGLGAAMLPALALICRGTYSSLCRTRRCSRLSALSNARQARASAGVATIPAAFGGP
jgi:DNA-binding transcriptional LysR family regulator